MGKEAFISIIVPVYNVQDYLVSCVTSIINQTYRDIEIILVDDGSTDDSGKLCDELGSRDGRIKVIHQENGGSTSARNAGLKIARGEYIGFVDSDDWIEPQMYEALLSACVEQKADMAVCQQFIDRGNVEFVDTRSVRSGGYKKGDGVVIHNLIYTDDWRQRGITPNLCDKLFRSDLLRRNQARVDVRTKFAEDDLCVYASLLEADIVVFLDTPYYHYRKRENSVCTSRDESYFEKITLFYVQMKRVFEEQEEAALLLEKLNRYMLEFVIRGINHSFGFGYGSVVPFYQPPYQQLKKADIRTIVLYGAGNVGRDYYFAFQRNRATEVVLWVDMRYESYQRQGLPVYSVEHLEGFKGYDAILIAVESSETMEKIRQTLIRDYCIEERKICMCGPSLLIEELNATGCAVVETGK